MQGEHDSEPAVVKPPLGAAEQHASTVENEPINCPPQLEVPSGSS